jgi:single-strand DNA-binding protein
MLNNIILNGRLTETPELKSTAQGTPVASFTVAVPRDYKKDGKEITDFIPCVAWRQTAEFVTRYFSKGSLIIVNGALESRKYEDSNGNKRTAYEVKADKVYFGGSKNEQAGATTQQPTISAAPDFEEINDDDLPF